MNPLDPLELQAFMRNLKEEMPIHTDATAKIKRSYSQGMPKNLMEYSAHVDNKFLNENLAIIEEMHHRDQIHPIPLWFRNYQLKHYFRHGILNRDGFFASRMHDGFLKPDLFEARWIGSHAMMNFKNVGFTSVIGNSKVFGSEITSGGSVSTSDSGTVVRASKGSSLGVIGTVYNQIAINCVLGGGNQKLALYNDSAGNPNSRRSETGGHAQNSGFNWISMPEVELDTQQTWHAHIADNTSATFRLQTLTDENKNDTTNYASAMPSTYTVNTTNSDAFNLKIGHT